MPINKIRSGKDTGLYSGKDMIFIKTDVAVWGYYSQIYLEFTPKIR